ncbi:MAG: hypothetical protein Q8K00_20860 [Syntrophales bacterium]|nr:hypothetical protein [Syntrophales bacterium]
MKPWQRGMQSASSTFTTLRQMLWIVDPLFPLLDELRRHIAATAKATP